VEPQSTAVRGPLTAVRGHLTAVRGLQDASPLLAPMGLVLAVTLLTQLGSAGVQRGGVLMLVYVTLVVSLYMFWGNSGVMSFGHMAFACMAAYLSAILTIPPGLKHAMLTELPAFLAHIELPWIEAIILGGLLAAAFSFVVGLPLSRLSGLAASIATFAVMVIVYVIASYWTTMTGGHASISVPMYTNLTSALLVALITIVVAYLYQESPFGLRLRASREDEEAARSIGVRVQKERLVAFVLSAFFTGIGGVLYGHYLGAIISDSFYVSAAFLPIAMLVVGGRKSLSGAVVGGVVIWAVSELMRNIESGVSLGVLNVQGPRGMRELAMGLVMLLILIYRPRGITGGREFSWPFGRRPRLEIGKESGNESPVEKAATGLSSPSTGLRKDQER